MRENWLLRTYRRGKEFLNRQWNQRIIGLEETLELEPEEREQILKKQTYTGPVNIYDRSYMPGMVGSSAGPFPMGKKSRKKKF